MRIQSRLLASVLTFAALVGCAHITPTATTTSAAALAAQATANGRDKACRAFFQEYNDLNWDYYKERKESLLRLIGNTGSALAVEPLTYEYNQLSWDYFKERKQLLMGTISRLSQVASQPCSPGFSAGTQDQICKTFLTEYHGLSWDYYADRKKLLLDTIANTGSDLAVDYLTQEYNGADWDYYKERKQILLATLSRLLAVAPPCDDKKLKAPTPVKRSAAAKKALAALKADLLKAPAAQRKVIEEVLAQG